MRESGIYHVAEWMARNVAYNRKKRLPSDARPTAKTSLFGGGVFGLSSFQGDQLQVACCGEQFCDDGIVADGFTGNILWVLIQLSIVGQFISSS